MHVDVTELEQYRPSLTGHCYRMLGSATDAEDAVQETIVRAWRSLDRFEGRSSIKTWLHRIATNVCLDTVSDNSRRFRPMEERPAGRPLLSPDEQLDSLDRTHWLEPIPDSRALPANDDPFQTAVLRQSIRLAFVAALQQLPARQRAALLLTEVLGWSAAEVAECLETSVASVNSALQRARATLGNRNLTTAEPLTEEEQEVVDQYVDAFQRYDVDTLVSLLRDDVNFSMPPITLWLQGPEHVRSWLLGAGCGCRGSKLVRVEACGSPAFAQYRAGETSGTYNAWALIVLELSGGRISGWNSFLDTETIFPLFGMPLHLS
ncbi:MAG TPA: sigma-70 family RNA polymerase sigma factor [Thermoanaerobaculia bacterium]|nr:sigma-70 family RNA polymerase sigma factor [Thermoanaerobaculia bacterium]